MTNGATQFKVMHLLNVITSKWLYITKLLCAHNKLRVESSINVAFLMKCGYKEEQQTVFHYFTMHNLLNLLNS